MDNCPYALRSPKIERPPLPAKTTFDGTKPPLESRQPKTTTGGIEALFSPVFDQSESRFAFDFGRAVAPSKGSLHTKCSLRDPIRVASGRAPLELECSSVILDAEECLRNALKPRDRLPLAARQSSFGDRISAIAGLGVASIAAERCAIAFRSGGAGADEVVRAPRGDSQWDAALDALLMALENRVNDVVAARGTRHAHDTSSIDSIETLALSARDIAAIASVKQIGEGLQVVASAFTEGGNALRIAMVAPADRARNELDASMELMARSVIGEIALASARASLDFWRTHGSESGRQAVGARRALVQERATTNGDRLSITLPQIPRRVT